MNAFQRSCTSSSLSSWLSSAQTNSAYRMTPPLVKSSHGSWRRSQSAAEPAQRRRLHRPRPPLAEKEEDVLDLDLAVFVEHVHPRSWRVHLGSVRPELDPGVHGEQRLLVVADGLDHLRAAGNDRIRELDQALHVCLDAVQVRL